MYLPQRRQACLGLLGHGVPALVGFLLGADFSETQVADPVSSTWGESLLYVLGFKVKTGVHCSVNLEYLPILGESLILGV